MHLTDDSKFVVEPSVVKTARAGDDPAADPADKSASTKEPVKDVKDPVEEPVEEPEDPVEEPVEKPATEKVNPKPTPVVVTDRKIIFPVNIIFTKNCSTARVRRQSV